MTKTIKEWQEEVTRIAIEHGFTWNLNENENIIDTVLLRIHGEVTEASEALRDEDWENFKEELADIFIRLVNLCEVVNIDLEKEVEKKHTKNILRPKLHGRKRR